MGRAATSDRNATQWRHAAFTGDRTTRNVLIRISMTNGEWILKKTSCWKAFYVITSFLSLRFYSKIWKVAIIINYTTQSYKVKKIMSVKVCEYRLTQPVHLAQRWSGETQSSESQASGRFAPAVRPDRWLADPAGWECLPGNAGEGCQSRSPTWSTWSCRATSPLALDCFLVTAEIIDLEVHFSVTITSGNDGIINNVS